MGKNNYKYSKKHSWVKLKRTVVDIGITDYFLNELGALIDLSLPRVGDEVISGISYGEIESLNKLSDLVSPASGGVIKVNTDLISKLKNIQKVPLDDSWFIRVRIAVPDQLDALMDEEGYEEYIKGFKKRRKKS